MHYRGRTALKTKKYAILACALLWASCRTPAPSPPIAPPPSPALPTPAEKPLPSLPPDLFPVHGKDDRPVAAFRSDTGEALILCTPGAPYRWEELSDINRIYQSEDLPELAIAWVTEQGLERIPLGRYPVLKEARPLTLASPRRGIALLLTCLKPQKIVHLLVSSGGNGLPSIDTFFTTPSMTTSFQDLDTDGTIDVLVTETVREEGVGRETYLSWYTWNGIRFSLERSLGIVRSLKAFFSKAGRLIRNGPDPFLSYACVPEAETLEDIFLAEGGDTLGLHGIRGITFPEISENPFPDGGRPGEKILVPVRIETGEGSFVATAFLGLKTFPFQDPPFEFLIDRPPTNP
ncbi:hypothetical protein STHERM_c00520 [Spirochaeta thermophila DSM 6192]|uniref:Lipoprotein n=1 Tax=Winmispira thermophila (strain ATCC 49972 / DSM 6192 / RI 19.B1) TaxID=665571 RepID=E0RTX2_WINT6|nr:hypothetical protein STHERM_c00520 [Spirochaeta thermophila DSM 6192]